MRLFRLSICLLTLALCGFSQSPGGLFGGGGSVTALAVAPNGYTPFASGAASVIVSHSFGAADFGPMEVQCWTGAGVGTWTPLTTGWTVSSVGATSVTIAFSPATSAAGACKVNFAGGVGPSGPTGPAGPTGATGPAGPASTTAADIVSGIFSPARLGSGTANNTTILYGDNVWRTAPTGGSGAATNGTSGQFLTSNGSGGFGTAIAPNTGGNGQIITSNGSGGFGTPINPTQFATAIHAHAATDITSGTLPILRLGASGTRDNTTILYGDNVWRTAPTGGSGGATIPNTTNLLKGNNTGGVIAAVPGTDYVGPSHNHDASQITTGTIDPARLPSGLTPSPANEFTFSNTSTTATITCPAGSVCGVEKGDSALPNSGYTGSFTPAGGTYTAYFCLDGDTVILAYNGTTITTHPGLTLVNGAIKCPANTLTLATADVAGTTVNSVTSLGTRYFQAKPLLCDDCPGYDDNGQRVLISVRVPQKLGSPFSPGSGTAGVLTDADLTWTGFVINDALPKTLTEASCTSDSGSQTITVTAGGTAAFTITCVPTGSYSRATTNGTTGFINGAAMANAGLGAGVALNQAGTANGSTHSVHLHVWGK